VVVIIREGKQPIIIIREEKAIVCIIREKTLIIITREEVATRKMSIAMENIILIIFVIHHVLVI